MLYFNKTLALWLVVEAPMVPFSFLPFGSTFYSCLGVTSFMGHLSVLDNTPRCGILTIQRLSAHCRRWPVNGICGCLTWNLCLWGGQWGTLLGLPTWLSLSVNEAGDIFSASPAFWNEWRGWPATVTPPLGEGAAAEAPAGSAMLHLLNRTQSPRPPDP